MAVFCPGRDTDLTSQSKLSPQQLEELQNSTHFDKKELQQWYKGLLDRILAAIPLQNTEVISNRIFKGLSVGHSHKRRVPEDLSTIFSFWRPELICESRL